MGNGDEITRLKMQIARELRPDGTLPPTVIWNLACLGQLRHERGEYVRAHRVFRRALDLSTRADPMCPKTLAFLLTGYGRLLQEMGHLLSRAS